MSEPSNPGIIIVMGVAGCGKTTVGKALSEALGWRFVDADDHHSAANIAKMARGEPLDDADRLPWLDRLHAMIAGALDGAPPLVLACSALKAAYRARLVGAAPSGRVRFVHLVGSPELLRERLARRTGHFMKPGMLESQFAILEPPADAITLSVALPVAAQVAAVLEQLRTQR